MAKRFMPAWSTGQGGIVTYTNNEGQECPLGCLLTLHCKVYEASLGAVAVDPAQAIVHNEALDTGLIDNLKHSAVGDRGTPAQTHLFEHIITFYRFGMKFQGKPQKDAGYFNFRRKA
jgi:hypothetical protein